MRDSDFYDMLYLTNPRKWEDEGRDKFTFEQVQEYKPESVIDIGCGNGHTLRYFRKEWPDAKYYGIDLSSEATWLANHYMPEGEYFTGDFLEMHQDLPYCDMAICLGTGEHFYEGVEFLRLLGNRADIVYLEVPNCLAYSDSHEEGWRETTGGSEQVEWHIRRETWEQRIESAGLEIVKSIQGPTKPTEFCWILKRCHTK